MTKIPKIEFSDVIKNRSFEYAQSVYPSIVFCNAMIDGGYANDYTHHLIEGLYRNWDGVRSIISEELVSDYTSMIHNKYKREINGDDIKDVIIFWLSYLLGIACSSEKTNKAFRLLRDMFYSYDGRGFYLGYKPKRGEMDFFHESNGLFPKKNANKWSCGKQY